MKEERSPESVFFQSSCEAVLRQDYKEAFSLLEKGLKEARNRFANQQDVVQLIAEIFGVAVLLEHGLDESIGIQATNEAVSPDKQKEEKCSFCGKTRSEVSKLIAGPDVFICDRCIRVCVQDLEPE
jgi:hypothetical protein